MVYLCKYTQKPYKTTSRFKSNILILNQFKQINTVFLILKTD